MREQLGQYYVLRRRCLVPTITHVFHVLIKESPQQSGHGLTRYKGVQMFDVGLTRVIFLLGWLLQLPL